MGNVSLKGFNPEQPKEGYRSQNTNAGEKTQGNSNKNKNADQLKNFGKSFILHDALPKAQAAE
tara:strand:+ start:203 stop:391 length:189 start_codon:yes stop_codon:yes gene_type:complete